MLVSVLPAACRLRPTRDRYICRCRPALLTATGSKSERFFRISTAKLHAESVPFKPHRHRVRHALLRLFPRCAGRSNTKASTRLSPSARTSSATPSRPIPTSPILNLFRPPGRRFRHRVRRRTATGTGRRWRCGQSGVLRCGPKRRMKCARRSRQASCASTWNRKASCCA